MDITKKIDMFIINEGSEVKLSPLAKSDKKSHQKWPLDELNSLVDKLSVNAGKMGKTGYEISWLPKDISSNDQEKPPISIYRKSSDTEKKMNNEEMAEYKKEIQTLLKGTGMKIVGNMRGAWYGFKITKE